MAATYALDVVQELVRWSRYRLTSAAGDGARVLGFDAQDVIDCVLALRSSDFHKTMPSARFAGRWQDVYRPHYLGVDLYVKLQIVADQHAEDLLVIISFKER